VPGVLSRPEQQRLVCVGVSGFVLVLQGVSRDLGTQVSGWSGLRTAYGLWFGEERLGFRV